MTGGFAADAAALVTAADRLDEAAEDTGAVAGALEVGVRGDLGPSGIGATFDQVTGDLATTMRAVAADLFAAAEVARTAGNAYAGADEDAAGVLRGIGGPDAG